MATYNGTSGNDTFSGGGAADLQINGGGTIGLSGRPAQGAILAGLGQEVSRRLVFAAFATPNVPYGLQPDAGNARSTSSLLEPVVG